MAASGREIIQRALDDLKTNTNADDARTFRNTSVKDVWDLARKIEQEQIKGAGLQNMRRIEPILRSLESYASVMDTFCQGFSPMAWVWGPIKLILMLAQQSSSVLEKILDAYKSIADHLPRIDKLQATFREDEDFRKVLGFIYEDIAEFHQRAYKIFRRRGWTILFAINWGLFERRFKSILTSISFRVELVDREAAAIHFSDMKKARDLDRLEYEKEERQRQSRMLQAVRSWLSAAEDGQEEYLEELAEKRQLRTCDWILEHDIMKNWVEPTENEPIVWLTGKPGGGKSVLASFLVQHLQSYQGATVVYYFCALNSDRATCADILRTMAFQSLQQNPDLASLVHEEYLQKVSTRSAPKMKGLLKEMFAVAKSVHIIIDGVDECERATQQDILKCISYIQRNSKDVIKILISSRREPQISESLPQKAHISLNGQTDGAVELFVAQKMQEIHEFFPNISKALLDRIEKRMLKMAKGMFLWVRLVTTMLKDQSTELELEKAVGQLPDGLDAVYRRILTRLDSLREPVRSRAYKILSWACATSRAVKVQEVADGVSLHPQHASVLNKQTRIRDTERDIVDICAPLVERSPTGVLEIVHFSAKEYLLHSQSGPFVDIAQAHFDIGSSCLSALIASFVVLPRFSPQTTRQDIEILMVEGYFGLHSYANDYWAFHVQDYFRHIEPCVEEIPPSRDPADMIDLLKNFSQVRRGFTTPVDSTLSQERSVPHARKFQLSDFPHISKFLEEWTCFRSRMRESDTLADTIDSQLESHRSQDPTYLSLIRQNVRSIKEHLLGILPEHLPGHINRDYFVAFRKELGADVYECRYGSCNHFSTSFERRLEHENSHIPTFPCRHCDFAGRGFKFRRDLDRHVKQYHSLDEDGTIPHGLTAVARPGQGIAMALQNSIGILQNSGHWSEKGRRALQATFSQVYRALALADSPLVKKDHPVASSGQGTQNASMKPPTILARIGVKIETQQYQSLKEFKDDVDFLSRLEEEGRAVQTRDAIETVIEKALFDATKTFPGFACTGKSNALRRKVDQPLDTELTESLDDLHVSSGDGDVPRAQGQPGRMSVFWSRSEESVLPDLLAQHGSKFHQIADFLKTKSPNDVKARFQALVKSGRQDLVEMMSAVDAKLGGSQKENGTVQMLGSDMPGDVLPCAFDGSMVRSEPPDSDYSHQYSPSPVHSHQGLVDASHYAALSGAADSAAKYLSTPKRAMQQQSGQDPEDTNRPKKYVRRAPAPAFCPHCKNHSKNGPLQLRDEYSLTKHLARFHSPFRKVWVCVDASIDKNFLNKCLSCRDSQRYSDKHSAAAHLRKTHFGHKTPMETLNRWMEEVEEPNPGHVTGLTNDLESSTSSQKLPSFSLWTNPDKEETPETSQVSPSKEIPLLEVSFDDILQGFSGATTPDGDRTPRFNRDPVLNSSVPHLAHQGLIRVEHVDKLPNLSAPRKAVTRDQVMVYYQALDRSDIKSREYEQALMDLKTLSQRLLKDLRDWRRGIAYAPDIRPSF